MAAVKLQATTAMRLVLIRASHLRVGPSFSRVGIQAPLAHLQGVGGSATLQLVLLEQLQQAEAGLKHGELEECRRGRWLLAVRA